MRCGPSVASVELIAVRLVLRGVDFVGVRSLDLVCQHGRSGNSSVRSSGTATKPGGSPRGDASAWPFAPAVLITQKGDIAMNFRQQCWSRWSITVSAARAFAHGVGQSVVDAACPALSTMAVDAGRDLDPLHKWRDQGFRGLPSIRSWRSAPRVLRGRGAEEEQSNYR